MFNIFKKKALEDVTSSTEAATVADAVTTETKRAPASVKEKTLVAA